MEHVPLDRKKPAGDTKMHIRSGGCMTFRFAKNAHRIQLFDNDRAPVWTLFFTGPRFRNWGFWCAKGWVPQQVFVVRDENGAYVTGKGCE